PKTCKQKEIRAHVPALKITAMVNREDVINMDVIITTITNVIQTTMKIMIQKTKIVINMAVIPMKMITTTTITQIIPRVTEAVLLMKMRMITMKTITHKVTEAVLPMKMKMMILPTNGIPIVEI